MKRLLCASFAAVIALAASACLFRREPPQYMQDVEKGEEAAKKAIAEIRKELGEEYKVEQCHDIFFVASNDTAGNFEIYKRTISRVYTFLTKEFFETKPSKPLRVFLFKDKASYNDYNKKAYGRDPSTPFGFYMASERKMVMNISTGTGTLAHELVHPLLAEDFPAVPAWFNEGFASLFEQSKTREDGRQVGLVNWRLPGLLRAMEENRSVPLVDLMKTDTPTFYGDEKGVNYATARYLCLYLQEKELLLKYYKEFKSTSKDDATGITALEKVTGQKLAELEKAWRAWVQKLKYP